MFKEFKDFISKGNVLDLAVAVIIGGAFGGIVTSLVNDMIMPIVGVIMGGVNFTGLAVQVGGATIKYGNFAQAVVNFLIIAFTLFMVVNSISRLKKTKEAAPVVPVVPLVPNQEKLLAEIRDLLKSK